MIFVFIKGYQFGHIAHIDTLGFLDTFAWFVVAMYWLRLFVWYVIYGTYICI